MKWLIPASTYKIWTDFSLKLDHDLVLETGKCYHLTGQNGSGKSSFIKQVLISHLLKQPESQFILYLEQQVQSQFDAVKANAALQKPSVHINNITDMFDYQLHQLSHQMKKEPKPVIFILDETVCLEQIVNWLNKNSTNQVCLIYVSHLQIDFPHFSEVSSIAAKPVSASLSRIVP